MSDNRGGEKRNVPHRPARHVESADTTRRIGRRGTLRFRDTLGGYANALWIAPKIWQ